MTLDLLAGLQYCFFLVIVPLCTIHNVPIHTNKSPSKKVKNSHEIRLVWLPLHTMYEECISKQLAQRWQTDMRKCTPQAACYAGFITGKNIVCDIVHINERPLMCPKSNCGFIALWSFRKWAKSSHNSGTIVLELSDTTNVNLGLIACRKSLIWTVIELMTLKTVYSLNSLPLVLNAVVEWCFHSNTPPEILKISALLKNFKCLLLFSPHTDTLTISFLQIRCDICVIPQACINQRSLTTSPIWKTFCHWAF